MVECSKFLKTSGQWMRPISRTTLVWSVPPPGLWLEITSQLSLCINILGFVVLYKSQFWFTMLPWYFWKKKMDNDGMGWNKHLKPMRPTCRLVKMRILSYTEPITECVRKKSYIHVCDTLLLSDLFYNWLKKWPNHNINQSYGVRRLE